ncbi:MAG: DUF4258 domain-containing protein [Flavobacteriaceae bacterium]|nr:DUF4258 domain-containing protein [Flavobacteriaceae bacterium]
MAWLRRFGYYLIGLSIGSIIVYFIWDNKDATFDYGMDARTLKQIRIRTKVYSTDAQATLIRHKLDTVTINTILKNGDVHFSKSKPRIKPCPEYYITGKDSLQHIHLYIQRCDSIATIQKVLIQN